MNEIVLETHHLSVGYTAPRRPATTVLKDVEGSLKRGELVCLLGPNGAGKSTLLRTIAGMQPPLDGRILLDGEDIHRLNPSERAKRLSLVLTERANPGLLTGYALVALGRHPHTGWMGRLSAHDRAVIRRAVEAVGAEALAPRLVGELSDGERQKIMIARALAQEPELMILDEPTAFLDLPRRVEVMQLLRQLAHTTRRTILLATHDLDLALRSADRLWLLPMGGPLQTGAPEDLVLNGAFERTFSSQGVTFDLMSGSFRIDGHHAGQIRLVGDGAPALWTQRALEREGFSITSNGSPALASVEIASGDPTRWRLICDDETLVFHSLYELVSAVSALASQQHEPLRPK